MAVRQRGRPAAGSGRRWSGSGYTRAGTSVMMEQVWFRDCSVWWLTLLVLHRRVLVKYRARNSSPTCTGLERHAAAR